MPVQDRCTPWRPRAARSSAAGVLAAAFLVVAGGCSASSDTNDETAPTPLPADSSILLVNDDGWDAPGITAAYDALVSKGYRVTMVAPLVNQSGRSMSTSDGALSVRRPDGDAPKYAVDGTPVDSLNVGLRGVLRDDPPDLVVSGINSGANVAGNTNYSGTVGAAAAAAEQGVPAIAVSADVGGPTGGADYPDAAQEVVDLVGALARNGFDRLGTDGFVNVNVPFETATRDAPKGVRVVQAAGAAPRTVEYDQTAPGTWTPRFAYDPRVGSPRSDAEKLADGWTTVTYLPTSRTPVAARQEQLRMLLER